MPEFNEPFRGTFCWSATNQRCAVASEIPGGGRFAITADPHGQHFGVFTRKPD
jgi:hypothetical protein